VCFQRSRKEFGITGTVTQMDQDVERSGEVTSLECQLGVAVGIRNYQNSHAGSVAKLVSHENTK
jgi:hypothetical protein